MTSHGHYCFPAAGLRFLVIWSILVTLVGDPLWSAPPLPAVPGEKEQKQEKNAQAGGFEAELFQGLDPLPEDQKSGPKKSGKAVDKKDQGPALDAERQRRLTQGEDIGEQSQSNSWLRVGRSMRNVESRIAAGDLGKETQQLQKTIVQDLAGLMKQFRQQASESSFRPGTGAASEAGTSDDTHDSTKPATDSSQRVGQDPGSQVASEETAMTPENLWGGLPPRIQTQWRGAAVDQFLPKYERLLEQFYRRLAEQTERGK